MPVTNYIYDPVTEAYLMETDGDGNMTAWYTQEPVKYGDIHAQRRIDPTTGVGKSYYYHPDALGSTRELTDESGTVVATYNYDAFGNTIASTGAVENPFRFTGNVGYYWDEELNTYHIRARNYQPTTGHWTSQDPIGFVDGPNLYIAYFVPNTTDPSGLMEGGQCRQSFPQPVPKQGEISAEDYAKIIADCEKKFPANFKKAYECSVKELSKKAGVAFLDEYKDWVVKMVCCRGQKTNTDPCRWGYTLPPPTRKNPKPKPEPYPKEKQCRFGLDGTWENEQIPDRGNCRDCCDFQACVDGLSSIGDLEEAVETLVSGSFTLVGCQADCAQRPNN